MIADAWQGRGIGTHPTGRLIAAARAHAIPRMQGTTYSTNATMLRLARKLGFHVRRMPGDATVMHVTLELSAPN